MACCEGRRVGELGKSLGPSLEKVGEDGELESIRYGCLLLYKDKNYEVCFVLFCLNLIIFLTDSPLKL